MLFRKDPAVTAPHGAPDDPLTSPRPPRKRGPRWALLGWGVVVFSLFGLYVAFPYFADHGPRIGVYSGTGFTTVAGRDAVLVPYSRVGSTDSMWSEIFQLRMAAVDLETGEELWDVNLRDELSLESKVLAAGRKYAYLVNREGLLIVAVDDGEVVAAEAGIKGLGEEYLAAFDAYVYDPDAAAIVVLDRDGGMRTIAVDELTARPATPEQVSIWRGTLDDDAFPPSGMTNEDEVLLAPDTVARLRSADGTAEPARTASVVHIATADGESRQLSDTEFYDASLLVDETVLYDDIPAGITPSKEWQRDTGFALSGGTGTAAGVAAGLVLVRHRVAADSAKYRVTVLSVETGDVLDTVDTAQPADSAVCGPGGAVVFPVSGHADRAEPDRVAVVSASGEAAVRDIGHTGLFGGW